MNKDFSNFDEWLEYRFRYDNHKKYHKYYQEWKDNLLVIQIQYFKKQYNNIITNALENRL